MIDGKMWKHYIRLWRASLDQLLQDLIYVGNGKEDKKAHINAWEWFENEQDEFDLVCDLADLDPIRTRKELNRFSKEDYVMIKIEENLKNALKLLSGKRQHEYGNKKINHEKYCKVFGLLI